MNPEVHITGSGMVVDGLRDATDLLVPHARYAGGFDPEKSLQGKRMRRRDRVSRLSLLAAEAALRDAGLLTGEGFTGQAERTATVVSTNFGNLDSICSFVDTIRTETSAALSTTGLPHTSSNAAAGWVALEHGLRGPCLTLCNGPTSGLDAVHWARVLIAAGRCDVAVVVGAEPANRYVERLLREHDEPLWPDGAAAVVVESAAHARSRGVKPRLAVGPYRRASDVDSIIAGIAPPDLAVLFGEAPTGSRTPVVDLAAWAGRQSGALGVLQCTAATAVLTTGSGSAVAGSCRIGGEAAAALVLNSPER